MLLEDEPCVDTWDGVSQNDDGGSGDAGSDDDSWRRLVPRGPEDEEPMVVIDGVGNDGPCSLMSQVEGGG